MSTQAKNAIVTLTVMLANACLSWRCSAEVCSSARDEIDRLMREASR